MKRVLFIIAPANFRDEELEEPKIILEGAGFICDVASLATELIKGMLGLLVKPDISVEKAELENYAAVIVVGGSGSPVLSKNPAVLSLLQQAAQQGKIIGAICFGSLTAARSGVLKGKRGTGWKHPDTLAAFRENGALYIDQGVVADGNIVTAQGPQVAKEFGKKLLELLKK